MSTVYRVYGQTIRREIVRLMRIKADGMQGVEALRKEILEEVHPALRDSKLEILESGLKVIAAYRVSISNRVKQYFAIKRGESTIPRTRLDIQVTKDGESDPILLTFDMFIG